jgi:polyisoprenoid-binding protein YceI
MTVRVSKGGMLSAFGHDHEISAPIGSGTVDSAARRVELHVQASALRVADPNASEKDREEVQKNMVGPEVLDAARYPEISFRSESAEKSGAGWTVAGKLTLHGQTRPITLQVTEKDGHFVGSASLRQTDYGIKPIKVAGGAVRVKDEVRIDFDIRLSGNSTTGN